MKTPRLIRTSALAVVLATVGLSSPQAALAGAVKGTVRLPDGARGARLHQGYWRLENGNVPVRPTTGKPTGVVVLTGISGVQAPPPKTVTVEISGLDAQPRVVVVGPGSVVEFKNVGKVVHDLSTPADSGVMPVQRLNPGTFRHQKFGAPGGYLVRCSDYPHLAISVIVVESPHYSLIDDKGTFQVPAGVPDGKATLKVWSAGRWVHEESIDTAGKQDLNIRVVGRSTGKESGKDSGKEPEAKDNETKEPDPANDKGI